MWLVTDVWPAFLGAAVLGAWLLYLGAERPRMGDVVRDGRFAIGLVLGGLVAQVVAGRWSPGLELGLWDQMLVPWAWLKIAGLALGGVLLGYGAARTRGFTFRGLLIALGVAVLIANGMLRGGGSL